jgi:hypothetical protein
MEIKDRKQSRFSDLDVLETQSLVAKYQEPNFSLQPAWLLKTHRSSLLDGRQCGSFYAIRYAPFNQGFVHASASPVL